jgi:large subunit ribosomal protein L15
MRLHELSPRPGARHRRKRLGCGESSGHGKTSGRGHKGQKARSGAAIRLGFEGGQMPLYRRIPRRGFSNAAFTTRHAIVNLSSLEKHFPAGAEIDEPALRQAGLVKGRCDGVKILGQGDVTKAFKLSVAAVSASAKEKIEKAGGSVTSGAAS